MNELTIAAAARFWVWLALLTLRQARPSLRAQLRTFTTITPLLFLLTATWLLFGWIHSRQEAAIVITREAIVHLGPLDESQTAFTAPDGTELSVLEHRDKWLQVSDRQNRVGWVKFGPVVIFPQQPKS